MRSVNLARLFATSTALMLIASACGGGSDEASDDPASAETSDTCVGEDTVTLGFLNSTTGVLAISDQTVRDSLNLAASESTLTVEF